MANNRDSPTPKTGLDDYICVQPQPGLKLVEREQCFPACKTACANSLKKGQLLLSCLPTSCLPYTVVEETPFPRKQGPWVTHTDQYPIGVNQFPATSAMRNMSESILEPKHGFSLAIHPLTSWRRYIRFNLTSLRQKGFSFDYLSSQISLLRDDWVPESCKTDDGVFAGQAPVDENITFAVLSNRGRLFSRTLNVQRDNLKKIDFTIKIASNVKTLRLMVYRSQRKFPYNHLCTSQVYALWSSVSLSYGRPLLTSCGSKCLVQNNRVYLSCLLGSCPGTAITASRPSEYASIDKFNQRSEICIDCSSKRRRNLPVRFSRQKPLKHLIGAHGDSRITFDLNSINELATDREHFNVLRVAVGIGHRALRKCRARRNSSSPTRAPLSFNIMLDDEIVRSIQLDTDKPNKDITVFLQPTRRYLKLEALAGSGHRMCSEAIWGEPRLEYNALFDFPACNRDCAEDFAGGEYPLSCMMGRKSCPGTSIREGSGVVSMGSKSWGVGVDTAGDWSIGIQGALFRRRIRFSGGRKSFKRGLGLHAPGQVEFDLAEMRRRGLQFNHIRLVIGLDVNSLMPICASRALRLSGEARIYGDGKLLRSWFLPHEHSRWLPQGDANLPIYGVGTEVFMPVSNLNKLKLVSLNPLNSVCSSVAFGEAKLISINL